MNFFNKLTGKQDDALAAYQKAERSLAEGMACLTNDAAGVHLRIRALSVKSAEAANLFQQALTAREKNLPPDHHDVGIALLDFVVAYELQAKESDATAYWERALDILKDGADCTQPVISAVQKLCDSGKLLRLDGPLDMAEQWHRRAVQLSQALLSADHPTTLQSTFDLAVTCDIQGKSEASQLYETVFSRQSNFLPVSGFLLNLAGAYQQLGRKEEAARMYSRALEIRSKAYPERDHADLVPLLQSYADFAGQTGDHATEAQLLIRALSIVETEKGSSDPVTAAVMVKTAIALMRAEIFDRAVPLFERGFVVRETSLGARSHQFARELRCLAGSYAMIEKFELSEQTFAQALSILEELEGADDAEIIDVGTNLAAIYCERDNLLEAESLIRRMAERSEKKLGVDAPPTATLKLLLQEVLAAKECPQT